MDINAFRNRLRLKQDELAEKLGLDKGSVGNLCSGTRRPSYGVVEKMLLEGARLDEVFSKEVQDAVFRTYAAAGEPVPSGLPGVGTTVFKNGVLMALKDLQKEGLISVNDLEINEKGGR